VHKGIYCNVRLQHVSAVIHFHGRLKLGTLKSFPEEVLDRDETKRNEINEKAYNYKKSSFVLLTSLR